MIIILLGGETIFFISLHACFIILAHRADALTAVILNNNVALSSQSILRAFMRESRRRPLLDVFNGSHLSHESEETVEDQTFFVARARDLFM